MTRVFMEKTARTCVCARCWGRIDLCTVDGELVLQCMNPDCDGQGFVTKHYAERRKEESLAESREVKETLYDLGVLKNPNADKSEDQLLKELGVM